MKNLFLFIVGISFSSMSIAQDGFSFCATAINLCDYDTTSQDLNGVINLAFPFNVNNSTCIGGKTRVFIKFECWNGGTTNTVGGTYLKYSAQNQSSSSTQTTLKIHGPFNANQNQCDLINSFQSPVAYDSTHTAPSNQQVNLNLQSGKIYYLEFLINSCQGNLDFNIDFRLLTCFHEPPCQSCLPTFQPSPGKYVISAWVKELNPAPGTTTYTDPQIKVHDNTGLLATLQTTGEIIDGWQKIEGQFTILDAALFKVELLNGSDTTLFDDIRIYPNDGSAITYVYDPITYRLMAELDERNYATLYEYDEEGKLIRIKKETEKGVMTIQENRDNNSLNNGQ